ncbi:MAG TPA: acetolactate synthase small subunit [Clostridiales bacterium]|jgi:acetolactate synthase-1/3 small subunit|nr:acetolactate synthase small subunit [Clostridiales bacterium]
MQQYILAVLVRNNAGVLARVASLFGRRGYNIDSLTVSETNNPGISYITLTVTGDEAILDQITKQAVKLEEVFEVRHINEANALGHELLLIKMEIDPATRTALREITDIYNAKIVDLAPTTMIIELTGSTSKINAFLNIMKGFSIVEMCRTGVTAMEKESSK